jgi:hypothetical protein
VTHRASSTWVLLTVPRSLVRDYYFVSVVHNVAVNLSIREAEYVKQELLLSDSEFSDALEQIKKSGISMKCSFAEPIKATEFIANKVFEEGEQEGVGCPFKIIIFPSVVL